MKNHINSFDDLRQSIGTAIDKLRTKKRMSQEQLADENGISQSFLNYILKGTTNPRLSTLYDIAKSLGYNLSVTFSKKPDDDIIR